MRLIDADALGVGRCSKDILPADYCAGWNGLINLIEQAPTIDAVEVVRCKDCKHWGGVVFGFRCKKWSSYPNTIIQTLEDDFCSHGERKEK